MKLTATTRLQLCQSKPQHFHNPFTRTVCIIASLEQLFKKASTTRHGIHQNQIVLGSSVVQVRNYLLFHQKVPRVALKAQTHPKINCSFKGRQVFRLHIRKQQPDGLRTQLSVQKNFFPSVSVLHASFALTLLSLSMAGAASAVVNLISGFSRFHGDTAIRTDNETFAGHFYIIAKSQVTVLVLEARIDLAQHHRSAVLNTKGQFVIGNSPASLLDRLIEGIDQLIHLVLTLIAFVAGKAVIKLHVRNRLGTREFQEISLLAFDCLPFNAVETTLWTRGNSLWPIDIVRHPHVATLATNTPLGYQGFAFGADFNLLNVKPMAMGIEMVPGGQLTNSGGAAAYQLKRLTNA